ncbi:MAG: hypothetical protein ACOYM3_12985 [Terrimicrobiaceae bacterium]
MSPPRFWTLLEQIGTSGAAACDWEILLGKTWKYAPLRRTLRIAGTIRDAANPDRHLELIEEAEDRYTTTFPLNSTISLTRIHVEVWIPDWNRLAEELARELRFIAVDPGSTGQTRQIGSITSRKLPASHVFLHIPGGHVGMQAALLRDMTSLPPSTLYLPSVGLLSGAVSKMAEARGIHVETIAERMAMPASERGTLLVRARSAARKTSPKKELLPILDLQPGWTWSNLRILLDPTGRICVQYGRQKGAFTFPKANGTKVNRPIEILATIAVKGCWKNPPSDAKNHERDRKAFQRLEKDLKLLIPIAGHPFDKAKGEWRPAFQISLSPEHAQRRLMEIEEDEWEQ